MMATGECHVYDFAIMSLMWWIILDAQRVNQLDEGEERRDAIYKGSDMIGRSAPQLTLSVRSVILG